MKKIFTLLFPSYNDLTQNKGLQLALANDGRIIGRSNMGK